VADGYARKQEAWKCIHLYAHGGLIVTEHAVQKQNISLQFRESW
jgi:hypothetical protein